MTKTNNIIKMKIIFKDKTKKDGSKFTQMLTIMKDKNGNDIWYQVRFGDNVNTKLWKNKNQIIEVENKTMPDGSKNIRIPDSNKLYEYKGKLKSPYIYIQEVLSYKDAPIKKVSHDVDPSTATFSVDDEDEPLN